MSKIFFWLTNFFHEKGFVIIKKGENVSSLGFDDNKKVMCLTNLLSMQYQTFEEFGQTLCQKKTSDRVKTVWDELL